jgi:hypothetical protein
MEGITEPFATWIHAGILYDLRATGPDVGVLAASDGRMVPVGLSAAAVAEWLGAGEGERTARAETALQPVRPAS